MGVQGHGRGRGRGVGNLMVLVTTAFCLAINPLIGLVTLLVSGKFGNLILELLDCLKKDFYDD